MPAATTECPHGGDFWCCPPCQRGDQPFTPTSNSNDFGAITTARYPGHCRECRSDIHAGQRIQLAERRWRHHDC